MWARVIAVGGVACAGVALEWLALAHLRPVDERGGGLVLLSALAVFAAGIWLCWLAAARLFRPPERACRVVNRISAGVLVTLVLTGILTFLMSRGIW